MPKSTEVTVNIPDRSLITTGNVFARTEVYQTICTEKYK